MLKMGKGSKIAFKREKAVRKPKRNHVYWKYTKKTKARLQKKKRHQKHNLLNLTITNQ